MTARGTISSISRPLCSATMEGGEGCANRLDSVGLKSVREMMKPWKQLTAASLGLALALLAGCATAERDTPSAAASPVVDPAAVAADAVTSTSGENIGAMVDPAIAQAGAQQATAAPAKRPPAPKSKGSVFSKVGFCDGRSSGVTESGCNTSKSMGESLHYEKKRPTPPATSAPTTQPTTAAGQF